MVLNSGYKAILSSVIFSRGVYGLCWFDLSAAFPAMAAHLHYLSLQSLGVFTAIFLLGSGILQIPAGLLSMRFGVKKVVLIGLALICVSSLLFAVTDSFGIQLAMRFLTGAGAGMYFAPTLAIVTDFSGREKSGTGVGIYYAVFYLGGGVSVFAFAPLAADLDWRIPFLVTSALTFAALVENALVLKNTPKEKTALRIPSIRAIFRSRIVWASALAILGVNAGYYLVSQFSVTYVEQQFLMTPVLAGTISSLLLFGAIFGAPIFGWVSDAVRKRRWTILAATFGSALPLFLLVSRTLYSTVAAVFVLGFFASASYAVVYSFPSQHREIDGALIPLAIGLINSTGILVVAIIAPYFAYFVSIAGYSAGWLLLGLITALLGPAIFLAKEPSSASK